VADRLELLIKDPVLRKRMGVAGRRRYEENYTVETFREKMEEVLQWESRQIKDHATAGPVGTHSLPGASASNR
jgi:hypothetical protein